MITGIHTIISSTDADRTRAFFRDTLGMRSVDAGGGWLIFALPPAELAAHPDEKGGTHQLYLMCDDIKKTMAELTRKGVKFTQPVTDRGWGLLSAFNLPGAGEFWIYEPKHPMAIKPSGKRAAKPAKKAAKKPTKKAARRVKRSKK